MKSRLACVCACAALGLALAGAVSPAEQPDRALLEVDGPAFGRLGELLRGGKLGESLGPVVQGVASGTRLAGALPPAAADDSAEQGGTLPDGTVAPPAGVPGSGFATPSAPGSPAVARAAGAPTHAAATFPGTGVATTHGQAVADAAPAPAAGQLVGGLINGGRLEGAFAKLRQGNGGGPLFANLLGGAKRPAGARDGLLGGLLGGRQAQQGAHGGLLGGLVGGLQGQRAAGGQGPFGGRLFDNAGAAGGLGNLFAGGAQQPNKQGGVQGVLGGMLGSLGQSVKGHADSLLGSTGSGLLSGASSLLGGAASSLLGGAASMAKSIASSRPAYQYEACVGCKFVWKSIHAQLDQSAGPNQVVSAFQRTCSNMPDVFFDACDTMARYQDAMVKDYLSGAKFEKMCEFVGLCWPGA